jgi:hypothetical protein
VSADAALDCSKEDINEFDTGNFLIRATSSKLTEHTMFIAEHSSKTYMPVCQPTLIRVLIEKGDLSWCVVVVVHNERKNLAPEPNIQVGS